MEDNDGWLEARAEQAKGSEHSNLPAATDLGAFDRQPHHRRRLEHCGARARRLAARSGRRAGPLRSRAGGAGLSDRPNPALRGDVRVLFPSLRRHPAPCLGRGLRIRVADDLCVWMGRRRGERRAYNRDLDCRPVDGGIMPMPQEQTRSALARAAGLGSAKEGVAHWWYERITAVALVPLTLWFIASLIAHSGSDYAVFVAWMKTPVVTLLMLLLLIALFYHTALGLQVVIEDYVHSAAKIPALIAMRFACFALASAGVLAVLRVAFGT